MSIKLDLDRSEVVPQAFIKRRGAKVLENFARYPCCEGCFFASWKKNSYFFIKHCNTFITRPAIRTSKIQEKPSAFESKNIKHET
jgi:hypothetical protein